MTHHKLRTILSAAVLSALILCGLLFVAAVSAPTENPAKYTGTDAVDPTATETDATATDAPASPTDAAPCEHVFETYEFLEEGRHAAICKLCGERSEQACVYAEPPVYRSSGDGAHAETCLLCGGERTADCEYADETVPPTQTEEGFTRHTCLLCGYEFTDAPVPPEGERAESVCLGDVDGENGVKPADARLLLRATVALERIPDERVPYADMDGSGDITPADARLALRSSVGLETPSRHEYTVSVQQAPTCENTGALTCECAYCGEARAVTIPAAGHDFALQDRTEPTCVRDGSEKYACSVCAKTKTVKLPAPGHRFAETTVEPACTVPGSVTAVCEVCGEKNVTVLPAPGHDWAEATAKSPKRCKVCGEMVTGWTEVDGKVLYFNQDGTLTKGKSVVSTTYKGTKGNWYLVNGVLDLTARTAATIDGVSWIVTEGKARKATTEADKTLFRAFLAVEKATKPGMTKEEKLWACFRYVKTAYGETNPRSPHYLGDDWPILYANDMFVRGKGNCCSYAAAFAYMAKAIGYENVYGCNSGGHGWAEIDGLVYDPEWSKGNTNSTYFGISYSANVGVNYKVIKSMIPYYSYAHVKI